MFKVWLEWDLGQDSFVFTSREKAEQWITDALAADESLSGDYPEGYADLKATGLGGVEELTVI